jgi:nitroimidazol reductase NimA-like FMN-containing flavoprotein (pyridoxamine 5'-phosphate oxidase superfamily)
MSFAMSQAEREQFLAQAHVGVLSLVDSGKPLSVPVWYGYEPGGTVTVVTGRASRKVRVISEAGWLSLCAQDESWPYKYATASGPAAVSGPARHAVQLAMAVRYLGDEGGEQYMTMVTASGEADEQVVIEMTPQHWLTADYSKPGSHGN